MIMDTLCTQRLQLSPRVQLKEMGMKYLSNIWTHLLILLKNQEKPFKVCLKF